MSSLSITLRLTAAFVFIITVTCFGVTWTLYKDLEKEIVWRDDQTLVSRARQMKRLLQDGTKPDQLALYFSMMADPRQDILFVRSTAGYNIDINQTGIKITHNETGTADTETTSELIHRITGTKGSEVTSVNVSGETDHHLVTITLARVATERSRVLRKYRRDSFIVCFFAVLASIVLSPLLIRKGLQAIKTFSQTTAETDCTGLSQPLNINTLPAELEPLGNALNVMRQRLSGDFCRLTQFADDLAHELRTPVNIMLGRNQVTLSKERTAEEYQQALIDNIEELEAISRLTDNILFLARAENNNVSIIRKDLNLSHEIENIIDFLISEAEEKEIRCVFNHAGSVNADRLLLQRAITNFLMNAIRYSPEKSIILIKSLSTSSYVEIQVWNQGQKLHDTGRLFQRFWRGDNARHSPGSGLGLALVKAIAELHDGDVFYRHESGYNIFGLTIRR
ncbi:heavy metal sensor histidine kinase [Salmonella enterica]|nr:heavy metal sensor histidine kinase [Salmonella enterica]